MKRFLLLAAGVFVIGMTFPLTAYSAKTEDAVLTDAVEEDDTVVMEEGDNEETGKESEETSQEEPETETTVIPVPTETPQEEKTEDEEVELLPEKPEAIVEQEKVIAKESKEELDHSETPAAVGSSRMADGWIQKNGNTYFYKNGSKLTGWQNINGQVFYFLKTGDANRKGRMLTGFQSINGKPYYFKKTGDYGTKGKMLTGMQNVGSKTYLFRSTGSYGEKGEMLTGFQNYNGKTYYLKKTGDTGIKGMMLTGFQNIGSKTYYFKKTGARGIKGAMLTGFQNIGSKTFFFKRTGAVGTKGMMLTGWQNIDSKRYYFKKTGERGVKGYMFKGVCNVSGEIYQFASDGHLVGEFTLAKPSISAWKKTGDSDWNPTGGDGVEYTVSWGKVSGATGYQICFSSRDIDEEMSGKAWHVDYITTKKLSYKVQFSDYPTHIKAKVRAYRKEGNTTIYSSWSSEVSKKCEWPEETSDPIDTFINSIKGNYYAVLPVGQDKENVIIVTSDPTKGGSKVTSSVFTPTTRGYDINLYTVDGNKVSWIGEKEGRISNGPWFIYKDKIAVYDAREGYHYLEISRDGYKDVHVKTLPKDLQSKSQTITLKRA